MIPAGRCITGLIVATLVLSRVFAQAAADEKAEQYAGQGQAALAAGHLDEAEQNFEKLRNLEPGVAEVHAMLGRIYFEQRKFKLAAKELRTALRLKPSLPKARTLLSISLSENAEYSEALPGLQDCFQHSSNPAEKHMCGLQLERACTALKMDRKAVEVALEMDQLYPEDAEVQYYSAKIYGNMAYQSISRLSVAAPNSPWRYLAAAEVNESQGATEAAIAQYRQVLAMDSSHSGVHYRIGRTLLAQGRKSGSEQDRSDALKEFMAELEVDPANANAAYEAGEIYRNTQKYAEAAKYFQSAIDYYPNFEDAHIGLATVYLAQNKPEPAVIELRKAIALDATNEVAWYRLSQAERSLGDSAAQTKAMMEFKKLHEAQRDKPAVGRAVADPSDVTKQKLDPEAAP
jgi:tetratricopeptide (TPR) repeat protein